MDCIFCKIVSGEIPSTCVYDSGGVYAFEDISPQAPVHLLVIPKEHIPSAADVTEENSAIVAKCFEAISRIAAQRGLENGFRVISNVGEDARQTVPHLHFHVLAGKDLGEKLVI